QDASSDVFFIRGGALALATGIPDHTLGAVTVLPKLPNLVLTGGATTTIQIGSVVKADVAVNLNAASGVATLSFTKVQVNVGDFLTKIAANVQSFTSNHLDKLAD